MKVVLGKHEFEVIANKENLIDIARGIFQFEEETYCQLWETPEGSGYLTKEEFEDNLKEFELEIEKACEESNLEYIVKDMPKKKNGTFYKSRKIVVSQCDNSTFFTEWHNSWNCIELRFSAISDLIVELQVVEKTETPC